VRGISQQRVTGGTAVDTGFGTERQRGSAMAATIFVSAIAMGAVLADRMRRFQCPVITIEEMAVVLIEGSPLDC
jgi:hypothetical protein